MPGTLFFFRTLKLASPLSLTQNLGFLKKNLDRSFQTEKQSRTFTSSFLCSFFRVKNLHRFPFWLFSGVKNLPGSISRSFSESRIIAEQFHFQSIFLDFFLVCHLFGPFFLTFPRIFCWFQEPYLCLFCNLFQE